MSWKNAHKHKKKMYRRSQLKFRQTELEQENAAMREILMVDHNYTAQQLQTLLDAKKNK